MDGFWGNGLINQSPFLYPVKRLLGAAPWGAGPRGDTQGPCDTFSLFFSHREINLAYPRQIHPKSP